MERYDTRSKSLNFIIWDFSNWSQFVYFDSVKSFIKNQHLGVIQGSKTGPLFFDKYSSDLISVCSRDESILYADDTVLVYVGTSL